MPRPDSAAAPPAVRLDPQKNLSHVDLGLPRASVGCVLRHCAASMAIYGSLLVLLLWNPWFRGLLEPSIGSVSARQFYIWFFMAYAALSPLLLLLIRPRSLWNSKNVLILAWLRRVARQILSGGRALPAGSWRPSYKEKNAFVFLLIKLMFGPLMLNGIFVEWHDFAPVLSQYAHSPTLISKLDAIYGLLVAGVFFLDSALFCFGYHAEAGFLKNEVRYVETSLYGILVCIICYGPFNMVTSTFLGPSNDDVNILFRGDLHHPMTWVLRGLAVLMLLLLTSASFSLFTRASNLTNRGIVQYGPYRWIRHPGYVGKNLFWLLTLAPLFVAVDFSNPYFPWKDHLLYCFGRLCGFAGWCSIYILRALTEERLLQQDPDYVEYCKKVRYRFIPGLI